MNLEIKREVHVRISPEDIKTLIKTFLRHDSKIEVEVDNISFCISTDGDGFNTFTGARCVGTDIK